MNVEQHELLSLDGYELQRTIRRGRTTTVYRGVRRSDGRPVILKCLHEENPEPRDLARLRREYEILKRFDDDSVVRPLAIEPCGSGLALVLEDIGGQSLRVHIVDEPLSMRMTLKIALGLCDALAAVHGHGVIHKDIKPENIIVNLDTGRVGLIDFSISSLLSEERQAVSNPDVLEGTLLYMSPEQTGRMNRRVDYRTDYYSLGVTLYELLTGRLPFEVADPMELVHCHIARVPPPLTTATGPVPRSLAKIVLKLMAKTAEARYQSVVGIRADLSRCLDFLDADEAIPDFEPGQSDVSEHFQIPEVLYGREESRASLLEAFDRVSRGANEIVLVSGPSGIGKSAVINEIHKPILASRGHFIVGKFEQFARDVPYASLIQAFRELIRQLLTEADDVLARWRTEIREGLGRNAKVVTDVLPELELIIGEQPPVAEVPAAEAANRFRSTFRNLVRVFAGEEHPLVVFLDDLQWSDLASLKLIEMLLTDGQTTHVLWLGAYRDNEVDEGHLLIETIGRLAEAGVPVLREEISPLTLEHTTELVRDTLKPSLEPPDKLAALLQSKTGGNPFFVRVLLSSLYEQSIIAFDAEHACWRWDLQRAEEARLSDDVVELMTEKIGELTAQAREVLKLGACIGNHFDLRLVSMLAEEPEFQVARNLWEAIERGLVRPVGDAYKYFAAGEDVDALSDVEDNEIAYQFVHDKVRQAAYSLLDPGERRYTHLRIGRLMLSDRSPAQVEEHIFDLVKHLNLGVSLIEDPEERKQVADLDRRAGLRATKSVAYDSAASLLRQGIELLPDDAWTSCYELTFALYKGCMEAEYLNGNRDAAKHLYEPLLGHARNDDERGEVYIQKVTLDASEKHNSEAVATAREGLKALGVSLPSGSTASILGELAKVQWNLRQRRTVDLSRLPELTDPRTLVALRLMITAVPAAYFEDTKYASVIMLRIANISLREGLSDASAFGFAGYGLVLSGVFNAHRAASEQADLATKLLDRYGNPWINVKISFMTALFIYTWVKPFREVRAQLHECYQNGQQSGDLNFMLYAGVKSVTISLLEGMNLRQVGDTIDFMFPQVRKHGELDGIGMLKTMDRVIRCLRGELPEPPSFSDVDFDEEAFCTELHDAEVPKPQAIFYYHLFKTMVLYLFGAHEEAEEHLAELESRIESMLAQPVIADFVFFQALNAAAIAKLSPSRRRKSEKVIGRGLKRLRKWAETCPENFGARSLLVEAELASLRRDTSSVLDLYGQAIESARRCRATYVEAIAFERAARASMDHGQRIFGESLLREARASYRRWGAIAKIELLIHEFPGALPREVGLTLPTVDFESMAHRDTTSSKATSFDIRSVIKASQAISSEIKIEPLLRQLVKVVMENAGARRGFIVLVKDGGLMIEAEGTVDPEEILVLQAEPVAECPRISTAIVNYVARTRNVVVLDDAANEGAFTKDPYVVEVKPLSVLCSPIVFRNALSGVIYLENNLATGAFTQERINLLKQLASQIAISVDNARLYEDLQVALDRALAADRAKTQFLMNMSHELRTPLNAVIGYTELIEEEAEDGDVQAFLSDLGKIRFSANRLLRTLTSILELSRLEIGDSEPRPTDIKIDDMFRRVREEVTLSAEENGNTVEFHRDEDLIEIRSDNWMVYYCLMSMLDNACRFTKDGRVSCTASRRFEDGQQWIIFDIEDSGIGIAPDMRDRLFEAFDQADYSPTRAYEGSGVSLAVVQRFARLLGGRVDVESVPGEGSTFTLRLPEGPARAIPERSGELAAASQ